MATGLVGNIMSLFSGPTAAPAAAGPTGPTGPTGAANPGQPLPGTAASAGTDNNGIVPAGSASSPATPLDKFGDVWKTVTTDPAASNDVGALFAGVDPKKIMESAGKVDFAKAISPEILSKIQAGGADATSALVQALNSVAQTVHAQGVIASTKLLEHGLTEAQKRYDAQLPGLVKRHSTSESLLADNPVFSNPALQPLVGALQEQLQRKNPNATGAEIQQQVVDYFNAVGTTFAPKPPEQKNSRGARSEDDWSKFFDM